MRRDFLEIDTALLPTLQDARLTLEDVEAIRLVLAGGSVVDWQRLPFRTLEQVDRFLALHRLDITDPDDRERLRYVYNEAVSYLEEHMHLSFPSRLRDPEDVRQVFLWASELGGFRRQQILSCVVLKLLHVIHHLEASSLKFKTSLSEEQLFDMAEADILYHGRRMRESGVPVLSFYGSRKTRSSVITKLLAKKETTGATVFDKLRFRVVVPRHEDLVLALAWLTQNMFPFNFVIPGQSWNNLYDPADLARYLSTVDLQRVPDLPSQSGSGKNEFSGSTYRMINFIVDYPVVLPSHLWARFNFELGKVVFVLVEFQIIDEATAAANEQGENNHRAYKDRQQEVVEKRLKRGGARRKG